MVLNPDTYNILRHRHNYTVDGSYIETAMFIPAYRIVYNLIDSRGWCNLAKAKEYWENERKAKANNPKSLLIYMSEYCFTIEEALLQEGDNYFPREELAEQKSRIEIYKECPKIYKGTLSWTYDENSNISGTRWTETDSGKILILEHPIKAQTGEDYTNLYVGGIDSIDIGTSDSSTSTDSKVSDFCIVIKKRLFGLDNPRYVAIYKDRPKDPREAYALAARLLMYYNCQAVLETTRSAILTYFRDNKFMRFLMKRPRATLPNVSKGNSTMIGTPTPPKVVKHYQELVYDYVLDYSMEIWFIEMIDQLLGYSDAMKKKYDIVAALGMAELGDEELSQKKPVVREAVKKQFKDIGWYTDAQGYKHYGVIPITEEERYGRSRIRVTDSWLYDDTL